jgi:hypothetical protein
VARAVAQVLRVRGAHLVRLQGHDPLASLHGGSGPARRSRSGRGASRRAGCVRAAGYGAVGGATRALSRRSWHIKLSRMSRRGQNAPRTRGFQFPLMNDRVALVTGASSGIGRATAGASAAKGRQGRARVVVAARQHGPGRLPGGRDRSRMRRGDGDPDGRVRADDVSEPRAPTLERFGHD